MTRISKQKRDRSKSPKKRKIKIESGERVKENVSKVAFKKHENAICDEHSKFFIAKI